MKSNPADKRICAVILAAGKSSRMGKFKPLLSIGGKAAIIRLIDSNRAAGTDGIIVVTGHNRTELEAVLPGDVVSAYNPDYEQGMFTSIKTGLRTAREIGDFDEYFLFPVDMPLIPAEVIEKLSAMTEELSDDFIVPCYRGKKGHPLVIPAKHLDEIMAYDGDRGLKGVTAGYDRSMVRVEVDDEAVVLDMDDPKDYEEILEYFGDAKTDTESGTGNILRLSGFEQRLFLIRHGSTRQHREKIFMGQTDVPLSETGREEVGALVGSLTEMHPNTDIIYTSPLLRAKESAEIIRDSFELNGDEKSIVEIPRFMERSLGDWDGRYIREIKEQYPEEYKKRGENLLGYKRSPDGENHFDLKYRVLKELKHILEKTEKGKDVIIVTHKGVINAIREDVFALDGGEAVRYDPPKGSITVIEDEVT